MICQLDWDAYRLHLLEGVTLRPLEHLLLGDVESLGLLAHLLLRVELLNVLFDLPLDVLQHS
jgi:hypothetical protein